MAAERKNTLLYKLGNNMCLLATYSETEWRYDDCGRIPATFILCLRNRPLPLHRQECFAAHFGVQRLALIDAGHQVMNSRPHALAELLRLKAAA
jgi:pimeloyl-ACP methyl ester carboxylesterase